MIRRTSHRPPARRGAILLVVLGMLALFAVIGLSFVLYAQSEATGAKNSSDAINELSAPDTADIANQFLGEVIFGTSNQTSAVFGVDLARSRFGPAGMQSPFTGTGVPAESLTLNGRDASNNAIALTIDRRNVVNFRTWNLPLPGPAFDPVNPDLTTGGVVINKAVPWTYPDRNNFWLAYYDPVTNQVTLPSFHREDLFTGGLAPNNPKWRNNGDPNGGDSTGYYQTLRPRQAEHPQFPTVPQNADGTFTGDVANLKFLTGSTTQKNDSLWMDIGLPRKTWRGRQYKALVAPLILDLSGRVNLSVAGNSKGFGGGHGSHHGWGVWEINPTGTLGGGPGDVSALMALRYTGANPVAPTPSSLDRFRNLSTGVLNNSLMPPQYARIDASGAGTGVADPMTLPAAGGFSPFPTYTNRFAFQQAAAVAPQQDLNSQLAATHGQSFSPYQWPRQTAPTANNVYVPSLEDQLRLMLPTGGPKGPTGFNGQFNPNPNLATLVSVSQRWGEIVVPAAGGTTAKLAAIDVARPLPDYRTNTNGPLSPQNIQNLSPARVARQNLARDIFVRLLAVQQWPAGYATAGSPVIDGTNVVYNPANGYVGIAHAPASPEFGYLRQWAQYAANMVDQIDNDDISTSFVWNPADPAQFDVNADLNNFAAAAIAGRTVFGTELPKLVLNEAYCMLNNSRRDSKDLANTGPPGMGLPITFPNRDTLLKKYWIELHNPLTLDPVLPDSGAARLQYDPAAGSQVFDATAGSLAAYTGAKYSPYQIEVAEVPTAAAGISTPYTSYLTTNPLAFVADTTTVPGMVTKLRLTDYTAWNSEQNPAVAAAPNMPVNDATNVVPPAGGAAGPQGYFLIGPRDLFPSNPQVANGLSVTDHDSAAQQPTVPANAALKNALIYDTGTRMPTGNTPPADNPTTTTSVVLLRRLVNPYLLPQPDPTQANYNPYMTVDYLENVPTRDRAQFDDTNDRTIGGWMANNGATVGRRHPYAASPVYNPAAVAAPFPAVVDQAPPAGGPAATTPPHTFLAANNANNPANLDNAAGLAWLVHLDREPVNQLELLSTSTVSPAQLTQRFYDGTLYQKHIGNAAAGTPAQPPPLDIINYTGMARIFDLLQVGSRLPGVPLGGREPGKINMNAVAHESALQAVLDPQSGNRFDTAYVSAAWGQLLAGRTPNGTPAVGATPAGISNQPVATFWEGNPTGDRPFQPGGQLFLDTLFRQNTITPNYPALFNQAAGNHTYLQAEPLRKGWNSLTTVSDGFLVVFTVGFFEVDGAGRLGQELSNGITGDFRTQYAAIVDRSAMTLNMDLMAVQPNVLGPKPWETKLVVDCPVGSNQITIQADATGAVFDDGRQVNIPVGSVLWVGYSMANPTSATHVNPVYTVAPQTTDGDGEAVRVTGVTTNPNGTATLTVTTVGGGNLTRFHGASSRVSNAPVGHPGPQAAFDYRDDKYRGVVPFFMQMKAKK